ncbi:hypothetical protein HID58_040894 [Brassica napus]|uniref:Uncharacterized protein n=1 Tax=Brassica napus TaxID=3708 RepID=A0ABQ8B9C8_BRANA|nr:hypothetical protein HID58_040894 [Brassica napus]
MHYAILWNNMLFMAIQISKGYHWNAHAAPPLQRLPPDHVIMCADPSWLNQLIQEKAAVNVAPG